MHKEKFRAYFKKKSLSKNETDRIQITNVLISVIESVTSAEHAYAEEEMQRHTSVRRNIKLKFLQNLRDKLACMREILVLLQQLKSSLLNIR